MRFRPAIWIVTLTLMVGWMAGATGSRAAESSPADTTGALNPDHQPAEDMVWGAVDYEADYRSYQARIAYYKNEIAKYDAQSRQAMGQFEHKLGAVGSHLRSNFNDWYSFRVNPISQSRVMEYTHRTAAAQQAYRTVKSSFPANVAAKPEDPKARGAIWTRHLAWLRRITQERAIQAAYHKERNNRINLYTDMWLGRFAKDALAGILDSASFTLAKTADAVVEKVISKCVYELVLKAGSDATFLSAFGSPFSGLASRLKSCASDVGKELLVKAWESALQSWFLTDAKSAGVPQEIAEFWWDEFVIAKAHKKKKDFFAKIKAETAKWTNMTTTEIAGRLGKQWIKSGRSEVLAREAISTYNADALAARFRANPGIWRNYMSEALRQAGSSASGGADLKTRLLAHHGMKQRAMETILADQSIREKMQKSAKAELESLKIADKILNFLAAADLFRKLFEKYILIAMNWDDFNMANAIHQYHQVVKCLKAQGKSADTGSVKTLLRRFQSDASQRPEGSTTSGNALHDYTAFLRSCKPGRQEKLEQRIAEAEAIKNGLDPASLPRDLPARLHALEEEINKFDRNTVKDADTDVDLTVFDIKQMCAWSSDEWDLLKGRLDKAREQYAELAGAVSSTAQYSSQICAAQDYAGARGLTDKLTQSADDAKRRGEEISWETGQLADKAKKVEPVDIAGLLAQHAALRQRADDLIAEIADTKTRKADMLAKADKAIGLVATLFEPRAEALESELRAMRKDIASVEIPTRHWHVDELPEIHGKIVALKAKQDDAMACVASLPKPGLVEMASEAETIAQKAKTDLAGIDAKKTAAEQCLVPLREAVVAKARTKIESCKFAEADEIIGQLAPSESVRTDLRAEAATRSARDSSNRATLSVNLNLFEIGEAENALQSLRREAPNLVCPETKAKYDEAIARVERVVQAMRKIRGDINACRFGPAEQAIGGFSGPASIKNKLGGELNDLKSRDAEALQQAQAIHARFDASSVKAGADLAELGFKRDRAACPDTKAAIQKMIDGLSRVSDDKLASARQALAKCDYARAEQIIGANPRGAAAQQLLAEIRAKSKAQDAALINLVGAKNAFRAGKMNQARPLAERVTGDKNACASTRAEAQRLLGDIARRDGDSVSERNRAAAEQVCGNKKVEYLPNGNFKCASVAQKPRPKPKPTPGEQAAAQICGKGNFIMLEGGNFKCGRPVAPQTQTAKSPPPVRRTPPTTTPRTPPPVTGQPTGNGAGGNARCEYFQRKAMDYLRRSQSVQRQMRSARPEQRQHFLRQMVELTDCQVRLTSMAKNDRCTNFKVPSG
ncbi:MAG: hypothetical protein O2912_06150 [Proteobacteria bacterium]|nr:hypothetical protein [Pseudomonadota bacterium]